MLFTEHLRMAALADSSFTTKVLSTDPHLFVSSFFYFIIDNCSYGSLLRKCLKMKIFTSIFFKTILPEQ